MAGKNGDILVDPLNKEDVPNIIKLMRQCEPHVTVRTESDYWLYTEFFADTCLGAHIDEVLVGAVIAFLGQSALPRVGYIQDLAVFPPFRRRGIGAILITRVIERLKVLGAKEVWLTSSVDNYTALRLWSRLGFKNQPADYKKGNLWVTKDAKGAGKDRVVFRRSLVDWECAA